MPSLRPLDVERPPQAQQDAPVLDHRGAEGGVGRRQRRTDEQRDPPASRRTRRRRAACPPGWSAGARRRAAARAVPGHAAARHRSPGGVGEQDQGERRLGDPWITEVSTSMVRTPPVGVAEEVPGDGEHERAGHVVAGEAPDRTAHPNSSSPSAATVAAVTPRSCAPPAPTRPPGPSVDQEPATDGRLVVEVALSRDVDDDLVDGPPVNGERRA